MALTVASRHYVPKAPVRLHKPLPLSLISILQKLSPKTPPAPKIPKAGPSSLFPPNRKRRKRKEARTPRPSILNSAFSAPPFSILLLEWDANAKISPVDSAPGLSESAIRLLRLYFIHPHLDWVFPFDLAFPFPPHFLSCPRPHHSVGRHFLT